MDIDEKVVVVVAVVEMNQDDIVVEFAVVDVAAVVEVDEANVKFDLIFLKNQHYCLLEIEIHMKVGSLFVLVE